MHLAGEPESPRLMTIRTGIDHTGRMQRWGGERLAGLAEPGSRRVHLQEPVTLERHGTNQGIQRGWTGGFE